MKEIKKVSVEKILPIRQEVLRPGRPYQDCVFEGDDKKENFHLAIYDKDKMVGVASFLKEKNNFFKPENQYRLRGMAVLPDYRNKKLGYKLLQAGIQILKTNQTELLWFNARTKATGFYQRYNFKIFGDEFTIPNVGPHFLMYKHI